MVERNKPQEASIFLLSIGTFLEYFDLMLYVHMAVLLNELFFPKTDPATAGLLNALSFSATFLFRPVGGLIVGWIGDKIGRKKTIIITTTSMALCCLVMAMLPTYTEIGVVASIIMICCRAIQGFSSMGEAIGAKLYMAESFKQPKRYVYGGFISIASMLGATMALIIATISVYINWRFAFLSGALIAIVGIIARTKLRESPDFVDYKRRMNLYQKSFSKISTKELSVTRFTKEKIDKKMVLSYFFLRVILSICFYSAYIYSSSFAKEYLGLSVQDAIFQNLKVNILGILVNCLIIYLTYRIHPFRMARLSALIVLAIMPIIPWYFSHLNTANSLLIVQFILGFIMFANDGLETVYFRHFPISYRFTLAAFVFGIAAAIAYSLVPFILEYGKNHIGHYALWLVYIPGTIGFLWGLNYAIKTEKKHGNYNCYPDLDDTSDNISFEGRSEYDLPSEYSGYKADCKYSNDLLKKLQNINRKSNAELDLLFIKKAIIFAKKWHDNQLRKSGEPYYSHPLAVASLISDFLPKTHVIIAAILHDIIEDTLCDIELIKHEFGIRIAEMVARLSRNVSAQINLKLSIKEVIEQIKKHNDTETLLIKALDRLHNLQTINGLTKQKRLEFVMETIEEISGSLQYAVDNLNIDNKHDLEKLTIRYCRDAIVSC